MKTDRLRHFLDNLKQGISRFLAFFVWSWILFGVLSLDILATPSPDWVERIALTLIMGMGFSIFFVLLSERLEKSAWLQWLCLLPMALTFFLFPDFDNAYIQMRYVGILLALACACLCLLFSNENRTNLIAHLIKAIFLTPLVAALLTGSILLCLSAIDTLIFNLELDFYAVVACFIWIVFFFNLFLAYVPKRKDTLSPAKLYKVLVLYIGLPVYLLLLAILLVYLLKIIITQHMPVGQINWFASFASLFFIFFSFAVRPYEENKFVRLFQRLIGFVILPIIAMQLIAVYERVTAYGLTTPRTVSLILTGIAIVFAFAAVLRKKNESLFYLVGAVILIFTLTPRFNIIDIPKQSQLQILEECLIKNNMLTETGIVSNGDVSQEDKEKIRSAYTYLRFSAEDPLPEWITDIKDEDFYEVFGFQEYEATHFIYHNYKGEVPVNIEGYRTMESGYWHESDFNTTDSKFRGFDIHAYCLELRESYGTSGTIAPIVIDANTALAIRNLSFEYRPEKNELLYLNISGYLLKK